MLDQFLDNIAKLSKKNEPFAIAVVVRREAPSSGKVGDKAVINKYGEILGWVGGGCVSGIAIKEGEDALKTGKSRLVRIGKAIVPSKNEGIMEYKMTCQGEGTVEIFIEPVMPKPHLVVIGKTAIARALVKLAGETGYRITAVAEDAKISTFSKVDELITPINLNNVTTTASTCIVIATQGEQDEKALEEALKKERLYLGFVASRKKMESISKYLVDAGFDKSAIDAIKSPAGIDINAKSPEEVAISILAEMIQYKNNSSGISSFERFDESKNELPALKYYINPVCGVPINTNHPKHIIEYKGEKVYFCCDGCKMKFEETPEKYMSKVE
jgi:xanthine dehydrogenase accessory factor